MHKWPLPNCREVCTDLLTQRRVGVDLCSVDRQRPTVQKLPASDQGGQLLYGFLWADPASSEEEKKSSNSRAGKFVESETRAFCERNNLALLVRSHEVPRTLRGVEQHHGGLCITVFSASNYCGSVGNRGAVLILRPGGGRTEPEALEHWAPPWPRLCTFLATGGDDGVLAARWEAAFGICPTDCLLGVDAPAETCEESVSASREQLMQFMAERIVEHKEELFDAFCQADADCTGVVDVSSWLDAMRQVLAPHCSVLTVQMLLEMAKNWSLKTPVPYVKFLHRFQIRDNPEDGSVLVDRIKIVSQLQNKLVDFSAINLEQLLDPDGDKAVSHREFASFLPQFHIQVPPWQAAALYETMAGMVDQDPINLDNTILCLALVSQDPPKREDDPCADVADAIGRKIMQSGDSLASIFRSWDEDNSGFLSLAELKNGLRSLPMSHRFTDEEVAVCMSKIDSLGKEDERLSIFEFIRALAPRRVTLELQRSMIREVLKRVWVCRPALLSSLSTRDPEATNEVDWDAFCECVLASEYL
ncbi:unnamed protein product [Effrenium voratum]|uniref:EF-hand domain-containing protein n=1 Tax=Effrenium voratum TaxID=2562239 RepID=A0AA36J8K0_9DINO|nr:unnamed protein product [Effrenium voratum]